MIVNNNFRENGNTLAFLKNSVMMRLSYAVVAIHELPLPIDTKAF